MLTTYVGAGVPNYILTLYPLSALPGLLGQPLEAVLPKHVLSTHGLSGKGQVIGLHLDMLSVWERSPASSGRWFTKSEYNTHPYCSSHLSLSWKSSWPTL